MSDSEFEYSSDEDPRDGSDDVTSWTYVSTHATRAEARGAAYRQWQARYRHLHTSKSVNLTRFTYSCCSHRECRHRMRITKTAQGFELEGRGSHNGGSSDKVRIGINPAILNHVDGLILGDYGAMMVLTILEQRFSKNPDMLAVLPTKRQISNRKSYLRSRLGVRFDTHAHLLEWAADRMCIDPADFFQDLVDFDEGSDWNRFMEQPRILQNEPIVLGSFQHDATDEEDASYGIIVTSRRLFRNVFYAVLSQGSDLLGMTDGTYKLHRGGWTLVDFGTTGANSEKGKITRAFYPWAYMFVRTETTQAYEFLFQTVLKAARCFFRVRLELRFGSLDHSWPIANAFRKVWPNIQLLSCWPHVLRNASKHTSLLKFPTSYENVILPALHILYKSRTRAQFLSLATQAFESWERLGEAAYASWFREQYMQEPWCDWFCTASDFGGVVPNQNPIEAHHRSMKTSGVTSLRAKTGIVLYQSLSGIFIYGANKCAGTQQINHFTAGPMEARRLDVARELIHPDNHKKVYKRGSARQELQMIVFNASTYRCYPGLGDGLPITRARIAVFSKSLHGKLSRNADFNDSKKEYQSMHAVHILTQNPYLTHNEDSPVWTLDEIMLVRRMYQCGEAGIDLERRRRDRRVTRVRPRMSQRYPPTLIVDIIDIDHHYRYPTLDLGSECHCGEADVGHNETYRAISSLRLLSGDVHWTTSSWRRSTDNVLRRCSEIRQCLPMKYAQLAMSN